VKQELSPRFHTSFIGLLITMAYIKLLSPIIFLVCAATGSLVHGQELSLGENSKSSTSNKNKGINRNAMTDGISGLLIDNMITPNGHQFFQLFSINWQNPESENYSLTFVETTSRLSGSQVLIYSGTKLMFISGLPYKSSLLGPVVDQAIEAINSGINSLATDTGSAEKDLGEEEL
jgi:hypothetical protein